MIDMSEETVLTNFRTKLATRNKLKEISLREQKPIGDILNELVEEYIKVHGEGNPVYPLDKWQDPQFKAVPAFLTGMEKWGLYFEKCTLDEIEEIRNQAYAIKSFIDKRYST